MPCTTELEEESAKLFTQDMVNLILQMRPDVTSISCSGKGLLDDNVILILEALAKNPNITALDLAHNKFGIGVMEALAVNKTITHLNIMQNNLGDEGAKVISTNSMIIVLNIRNNSVGVKGAEALALNHSIVYMDARNNNFGPEGTECLMKSKTLVKLKLMHLDTITADAKISYQGLRDQQLGAKKHQEMLEHIDANNNFLNNVFVIILSGDELSSLELIFCYQHMAAVASYFLMNQPLMWDCQQYEYNRSEAENWLVTNILFADGAFFASMGICKYGLPILDSSGVLLPEEVIGNVASYLGSSDIDLL